MPSQVPRRNTRCSAKERKSPLSRHLQRMYPIGFQKGPSILSISPLSLSHNSNDSSFSGSLSSWDRRSSLSILSLFGSTGRRVAFEDQKDGWGGALACEIEFLDERGSSLDCQNNSDDEDDNAIIAEDGRLKRCSWITRTTEDHYVLFHDECWGVPVFKDRELFELLSMSGMLIDQNWAEIVRKRQLYREVLGNFDPEVVAKMEEDEIIEIGSHKELMLHEGRVRCVVNNAKCILQVVEEYGSFGEYIWGQINYRPKISGHRNVSSIPIRTLRSESLSKDLIRRGFRLVGPVIIYSFMQAAGLAIDHLVDCFRFKECSRIARRLRRGWESS